MKSDIVPSKDYKKWLADIKERIQQRQIKAALTVNSELLTLYWELGAMIVEKQKNANWGDSILKQLSSDLQKEFPTLKGFSETNLKYIRKWYQFYLPTLPNAGRISIGDESAISPQAVDLIGGANKNRISPQAVDLFVPHYLVSIPWGHHREIITKCRSAEEAIFFIQNTITHNWSRSVLVHQIESGLFDRDGKSVNNFQLTLPKPQADLAIQTMKDPYIFDFLELTKEYQETDLENALINHITKFLLELGAGFSYMGRQYHLEAGGDDFYLDLLFYHTKLHCYVVVEIKVVKFQPEFAGKLNFYLSLVDDKLKEKEDKPTIGLLICKEKNRVVAEYALRDINKPIGITEYQLTKKFPKELKGSLPTIEELEKELE